MFIRSLRAEAQKLKGSFIWLAVIALPLLSAVLGTGNYLGNIGLLTEQWYSLWSQHSLFYCMLFAPALSGVYCAYLCRLEHFDHNWNTLLTMPIPYWAIFASKLTIAAILSGATQLWIGALYIICGKMVGFSASIPPELGLWLLRGWGALIVQASLLLCCALIVQAFAVPVALGLAGGFCGFILMAKGYGAYFPFSLLTIGMCANRPHAPMPCTTPFFVLAILFFSLAGILFGTVWLARHDVQAS